MSRGREVRDPPQVDPSSARMAGRTLRGPIAAPDRASGAVSPRHHRRTRDMQVRTITRRRVLLAAEATANAHRGSALLLVRQGGSAVAVVGPTSHPVPAAATSTLAKDT